MASKKLLVTLTTTNGSNWKDKIDEINRLNLREIALFPTCLKKSERLELYSMLENSSVTSIPHVHLRDDMDLDELDFLITKFDTKVFNIHPGIFHPLMYDLSKYSSMIFVENTGGECPTEDEVKKFGGLCVDFSHLANETLIKNKSFLDKFWSLTKKYKIGCAHVSAIKKEMSEDPYIKGVFKFDGHSLKDFSEMDYIKEFKNILPEFICIELENSIEEQLRVKEYLEKIIN